MRKLLVMLLLPMAAFSQQQFCSPYHDIPSYQSNRDVYYTVAAVACVHSLGVTATTGTRAVQLGTTIMDRHHQNNAYLFLELVKNIEYARLHIGPVYRVNNAPEWGLFRFGIDTRLTNQLYITTSLTQMEKHLGYANFGLKVIL